MKITFYHNPRCSKSRAVKALLDDRNEEITTIEYLHQPFTKEQLNDMIAALNRPAASLLRTGEEVFKALSLDTEKLDDDDIIELLIEHPQLFQRPVVVAGNQARIGRPPHEILEIFT